MNKTFKEAFEKTKVAGSIAAGALDIHFQRNLVILKQILLSIQKIKTFLQL